MSIVKLTLGTEYPTPVYQFLEANCYLMSPPCSAERFLDITRQHGILMSQSLKTYTSAMKSDVLHLSPEDIDFAKDVIQQGFYEFIENHYKNRPDDAEYFKQHFSVRLTDECKCEQNDGKTFYVFPSSYSEKPVIQF